MIVCTVPNRSDYDWEGIFCFLIKVHQFCIKLHLLEYLLMHIRRVIWHNFSLGAILVINRHIYLNLKCIGCTQIVDNLILLIFQTQKIP